MVFYVCGVPVAGIQEAQAMYAIAIAGGALFQAEQIAGVIARCNTWGCNHEPSSLWIRSFQS